MCGGSQSSQERRNKLLRRLEKLDMQQRRLERHLSDAAAIAAVASAAPRPRAVAAPDRGPGLSGGARCLQSRVAPRAPPMLTARPFSHGLHTMFLHQDPLCHAAAPCVCVSFGGGLATIETARQGVLGLAA